MPERTLLQFLESLPEPVRAALLSAVVALTEYGAHVEGVRQWGRAERAKLGL